MGNAIKFTFKGGITIKVNFDDGLLVTECEDTGIGIKENDIASLFEAF